MLSVAIFGGNKVDGSRIDPGERVVALALFGGIDLDFVSAPPPPLTEVMVVAVFGGATLKVRPEQDVKMSGFSLFGGRSVEPRKQPPSAASAVPASLSDDDDTSELPLDVTAYAIFGGVSVKREDELEDDNA